MAYKLKNKRRSNRRLVKSNKKIKLGLLPRRKCQFFGLRSHRSSQDQEEQDQGEVVNLDSVLLLTSLKHHLQKPPL